jgi:hypothetical protein
MPRRTPCLLATALASLAMTGCGGADPEADAPLFGMDLRGARELHLLVYLDVGCETLETSRPRPDYGPYVIRLDHQTPNQLLFHMSGIPPGPITARVEARSANNQILSHACNDLAWVGDGFTSVVRVDTTSQ